MMNLAILILLFSCSGTTESNDQKGKNRIERVKLLPVRSMGISPTLKNKLDRMLIDMWKENPVDSDDEYLLYKVSKDGKAEKVSHSYDELTLARNGSYELWRDKDFEFTYLAYKSYVRNMETREESPIYVIEVEHEELTGTYYLFIPVDQDFEIETLESNYADRN